MYPIFRAADSSCRAYCLGVSTCLCKVWHVVLLCIALLDASGSP
nr:MAG TPA: hypothetical protein [Caudoviricetes sp.]